MLSFVVVVLVLALTVGVIFFPQLLPCFFVAAINYVVLTVKRKIVLVTSFLANLFHCQRNLAEAAI